MRSSCVGKNGRLASNSLRCLPVVGRLRNVPRPCDVGKKDDMDRPAKIVLAVLVACVVWVAQPSTVTAAPKNKTTCIHTGNAWFFRPCWWKKPRKCRLVYAIQFFMYNWEPQTKRFTFRCTVRYGHKLRKQKVVVQHVVLERSVNSLGGVVPTWPGIEIDKVKGRHKYKCTCTISSLLLATSRKAKRPWQTKITYNHW